MRDNFWFCCLYFVSKIYFVCWYISLGIFFSFLKNICSLIYPFIYIYLFGYIRS